MCAGSWFPFEGVNDKMWSTGAGADGTERRNTWHVQGQLDQLCKSIMRLLRSPACLVALSWLNHPHDGILPRMPSIGYPRGCDEESSSLMRYHDEDSDVSRCLMRNHHCAVSDSCATGTTSQKTYGRPADPDCAKLCSQISDVRADQQVISLINHLTMVSCSTPRMKL
jgi:hypothetical protein